MDEFLEFGNKFTDFTKKNKDIVINSLSNIFSMRLIGNKTHGDLAEIGLCEFINQFMDDYTSKHVGKEMFRGKEHEEDISIFNNNSKEKTLISLKAYGLGPLQLLTDSSQKLFPYLKSLGKDITKDINEVFKSSAFKDFKETHTMPLIYNEKKQKKTGRIVDCECNIMIFNKIKAAEHTCRILYIDKGEKYDKTTQTVLEGKQRKHPVFIFLDKDGDYIFEVRYGGASNNALQRGLWTHTKNAENYFDSLTDGWIPYSHNEDLVKLFRLALNSTTEVHKKINQNLTKHLLLDYSKIKT